MVVFSSEPDVFSGDNHTDPFNNLSQPCSTVAGVISPVKRLRLPINVGFEQKNTICTAISYGPMHAQWILQSQVWQGAKQRAVAKNMHRVVFGGLTIVGSAVWCTRTCRSKYRVESEHRRRHRKYHIVIPPLLGDSSKDLDRFCRFKTIQE